MKRLSLVLVLVLSILLAAPALAAEDDFTIENGVLTKYNGSGGDVVIPDGVTIIGEEAFFRNSEITSVVIPDSVTTIEAAAFMGCDYLSSVELSDSLITIGSQAFYDCEELNNVKIPNNVINIGYCAFAGCSSLKAVIIPQSVSKMSCSFIMCEGLQEIIVDSDNPYFQSKDGVLYDKAGTTILCYPSGKYGEYSIPSGVEYISFQAFGGCSGLTAISIPDSIIYIGQYAFGDCDNLKDIYYDGTAEQWNAIMLEVDNEKIMYTTIHYNFEKPEIRGSVSVTVTGVAVQWTDAAPFIDENSRTMVPLRAVANALGLTVDWDGAKREAIFADGEKTIYFPIGSSAARTGDGGTVQMDTAAVIVNDRTYAPIRYLAEYFGFIVGWDGATKTVLIAEATP